MPRLNPQKNIFLLRNRFLKDIRFFFEQHEFLETQTPSLVENPGLEPNLKYFHTTVKKNELGPSSKTELYYLRTSPEYHLKKLLSLNIEKLFEISNSFRNAEISSEHYPEFLLLEWYQCPGSYLDIIQDVKNLFLYFSTKHYSLNQNYHLNKVDVIDFCDLFKNHINFDLDTCLKNKNYESLLEKIPEKINCKCPQEAIDYLFVDQIQKKLGKNNPVIINHYPYFKGGLAKTLTSTPWLSKRFEVYIKGHELANAFDEVIDSSKQRELCLEDINQRKNLYPQAPCPTIDDDFLIALEKIKNPAGGIALGLDRLLMLLDEKNSLNDISLFHWD